ncbi:MAG TPA: low temperature requirement protein A [Acidimicrobiia bacterium]|nr:low temperature requirement protein A [Acidimicrobiia bacterium]
MTRVTPMVGRSPTEAHRSATPLELLFDLVFVVAVAFASLELHHAIAEDHLWEGVVGYAMVFFAVWWPWINFTWFASAYDTDDVPYRVLTLVQLTGALIVAAGVPRLFESMDLGVALLGYVVMRLAGVTQWLRVARSDEAGRQTALRYAIGITLVQLAWIGLYFSPEVALVPGFVALVVGELLIPAWAERASPTPWHREHIAERYGLFTIIVLGESILSASIAIQAASGGAGLGELAWIVVGGLLIVYSMWWLYFERPSHDILTSLRRAFVWGYGHYFVWASAAAVGAGIAVSIDQAKDAAVIGRTGAATSVAVPLAIYVVGVWVLLDLPHGLSKGEKAAGPVGAGAILLTPFTAQPVMFAGLVMTALIVFKVAHRPQEGAT